MTDLSDLEHAVRRESASVRYHVPATLETIGIALDSIGGRQMRQDNRFAEIFRDFDQLHATVADQRVQLEAIETKLDRLLEVHDQRGEGRDRRSASTT